MNDKEQREQDILNNEDSTNEYSKLTFVANILNASPTDNNGGGGGNNPLVTFSNIIANEYTEFANSVSLKEEVEAFTKLQSLQNELARLYSLRDIANKSVVAIGGGFSAGKSQFVSSFFKDNTIELPIGINPVTAISTYIIHGDKHLIKGYSYKGGVVDIPITLYKNLSHNFLKALGFNLKDILPMVAMETSIPEFTHICFVDTPGYNPSNIGTTSKDSNTAKEALENANALIWLVGLDTNGTIPKSDLDFLDSLELDNKKLYIVANKADLKPKSEIEKILDHFEEVLDERGLEYEGISAYNSRKKEEITFRHKNLKDFIHSVDKDIVSKDKIAQDLYEIFCMYEKTLIVQKNEKNNIKKLLHSLELDLLEQNISTNDNILDKIAQLRNTTNTKDIESSLQSLDKLKDSMFEALNVIFQDLFKSTFDVDSLGTKESVDTTTESKKEIEQIGISHTLKKAQEFIDKGYRTYDNKDYKKAAQYFEEALKLGVDDSDIYSKIGYSYCNIKNYTKAIECFEKAYKLGNGDACCRLGIMYYKAQGIQQDYAKAKELYEKGCELGNASACYNLGSMYKNGRGVQQDYTKAIEYFEKARKLGNAKAYHALAYIYKNGMGVKKDKDKAKEYSQIAERIKLKSTFDVDSLGTKESVDTTTESKKEIGHSGFLNVINMMFSSQGQHKDNKEQNVDTIENMTDCIKQADIEYSNNHYEKALQFYEKAFSLGFQDNTGEIYYKMGECCYITQDGTKAIEYYKKAGDQGIGMGYKLLADMYLNGMYVAQNYKKAIELYNKALQLFNDTESQAIKEVKSILTGLGIYR